MANEAKHWWEKHALQFQNTAKLPVDIFYDGNGIVIENNIKLIGIVKDKNILEIGCGGAQCGIAFAKQGAIVTGIDISSTQIEYAKQLALNQNVNIKLLQQDMTDLSQFMNETYDIVFSSSALSYVDDLAYCFSEVYRVLRRGGIFVWGVGHPCFWDTNEDISKMRSYFDTGKIISGNEVSNEIGFAFANNKRKVSDYINTLIESKFTIIKMVEPDIRPIDINNPDYKKWGISTKSLEIFPATLIIKSIKY
jgi:ubiquinone/menaquinone biosynthesis C-methylase UbiE